MKPLIDRLVKNVNGATTIARLHNIIGSKALSRDDLTTLFAQSAFEEGKTCPIENEDAPLYTRHHSALEMITNILVTQEDNAALLHAFSAAVLTTARYDLYAVEDQNGRANVLAFDREDESVYNLHFGEVIDIDAAIENDMSAGYQHGLKNRLHSLNSWKTYLAHIRNAVPREGFTAWADAHIQSIDTFTAKANVQRQRKPKA